MTIAVVYVYPAIHQNVYNGMARRFAQTYLEHPPGETDHELFVAVNGGGEITRQQEKLFEPLAPNFIYHDNRGKDMGAYQMCSRTIPCDLLVCLGAPIRCRAAGWLDIIARSYEDHGPGYYGNWAFHTPAPHIRTTAFWITPEIFNSYPVQIHDGLRYESEHGTTSITRFCMSKNFPVLQVTLRGTYDISNWHHVSPQDSLFLDQHFERHGV